MALPDMQRYLVRCIGNCSVDLRFRLQREMKRLRMSDAVQALLDSGGLYLVLGAVLCILLGVGAARRLFQGAKRAEPPDSP